MNQESINDLVHRAVQRAVSKLRPVSLQVKTPQAPRKTSRSRKNERSSSANRSKRRDLSRNGNQHKPAWTGVEVDHGGRVSIALSKLLRPGPEYGHFLLINI